MPPEAQIPPTEDTGEMPLATPPAAPPTGEMPPATPPAEDPQAVRTELERTRAALKVANKEATERRLKIEAYEKAEAERKQAEMNELERLQAAKEAAEKRAADAEAQASQRLVEAAFVAEASKLGVKFPEDAYALADRSGVIVDESGKVLGVAEATKALVTSGRLPLNTPAAPPLDGGSGSGQPQTRVALTAEEEAIARKMGIKPEEYAQYKKPSGPEDRRL